MNQRTTTDREWLTEEWNEAPVEKRRGQRLAVTQETLGASQWILEVGSFRHRADFVAAMRDLAARAGGINPFFQIESLSASIDRIDDPDKRLLLLWERIGDEAILKLAFPFREQRAGLPPRPALRAWTHPYAPLGMPLVDLDDLEEVARRFGELFPRLPVDKGLPLIFPDFPLSLPQSAIFLESLRRAGLHVQAVARRNRASLTPPAKSIGETVLKPLANKKRRHELERQLRVLEREGPVEFEIHRDFNDVMVKFEEFLLLETRGWKGRRGTSIHILKRTAAYARQMVAAFANRGLAEIHVMRLNGQPLASLIMLKSHGRYYPWKIAVSEKHVRQSPGIHLMVRASREMIADPEFVFADSLSGESSWMDRIWPETVELATVVVSAHGAPAAWRAAAALDRVDQLRRKIKKLMRR